MTPPAHRLRVSPGDLLATEDGRCVVVVAWRGEGSYAVVYRATLVPGELPCALKLARAEVQDAAGRLDREAALLSRTSHPKLVRLHARGLPDGVPFLALEWLEGSTLFELLAERRRLPLRQALDILEAVLDAVACLHAAGAAHGDLRPQNVLVVRERGAVVTDPGAAPSLGAETGPPPSEEDVRAAGRLFYRMLVGEDPSAGALKLTPSAGYNRKAVEIWQATLADPPAPAAELLQAVRRLRASL